jgi:uncharacterized protein YbjT (DUF2867 family)
MIFLAGGSRGVGYEIATQLVAAQQSVLALVRSPEATARLAPLGISTVQGDALDADAMGKALASAPIEAIISTVGGLPKDGQRADYLGNRNLVDAAVSAGIKRFILISSIGSGNSSVALPPRVLEALGAVLVEKEQAENHLINSGLTYTIIRPGGLTSDPPTGNGILTADPTVSGTIHRADVAQLVCRCLASPQAENQVLSAVDRQMMSNPSIAVFSVGS